MKVQKYISRHLQTGPWSTGVLLSTLVSVPQMSVSLCLSPEQDNVLYTCVFQTISVSRKNDLC